MVGFFYALEEELATASCTGGICLANMRANQFSSATDAERGKKFFHILFGGIKFLLYLCTEQLNNTIMSQEKPKINVHLSKFERPLSFNEWSEKLNVSSRYVEPTKYFQGNPSCGIQPIQVESRVERFFKSIFKF